MKILTYPAYSNSAIKTLMKGLYCTTVSATTVAEARKADYDVVLIQGGADINPFFYGESSTHTHSFSKERDAVEWTILRRAINEQKPIMGICRGMQFVNVAFGGSLYQDIYQQGITRRHPFRHELTEVKNPLLNKLPTLNVNSRHHQAIKTVGAGFKVLAKSPDGVIEAIWKPGVLGVQWHPEDLWEADHRWYGLFKWLLEGLK